MSRARMTLLALAATAVAGVAATVVGDADDRPPAHAQDPKDECPRDALRLPADALAGATHAALEEAPEVYRGTDLRGMLVVSAKREDTGRSGYARVTCGRRAHRRTVVVALRFPAERPSASLSQGTVLISRFADGYHIWSRFH
jgi:hypothetical protein